ncbi:hypothetical protein FHS91_002588 [Sphingobium xanthum]|uniref:hypothetical protein n=1 Tax=Sphingobium xanthum TaxID=1387165 RepID=UPI001C8BB328|nr:hypothetical protein [Sphingobium xanthum]
MSIFLFENVRPFFSAASIISKYSVNFFNAFILQASSILGETRARWRQVTASASARNPSGTFRFPTAIEPWQPHLAL